MRAFILDSFDAPPGLREGLPEPEAGPGRLLVRVQASSVNPVDALITAGYLSGMAEHRFPVVLGRDVAGVVEEVGSGVTGFATGDRVVGGVPAMAPAVGQGAWAELVAVPAESVARLPDGVDLGQAGAAPWAGLTALAAAASAAPRK